MKQLSVDAIAFQEHNSEKICLVFQEDGFSLSQLNSEPTSVKYSQIYKYGTSAHHHDNEPTTCLCVWYNFNNLKQDQKCIHFNFEDEVLVAVLKVLIEFVDNDPHHPDYDAPIKPTERTKMGATNSPLTEYSSRSPRCCTTLLVETHVTFLQFVGNTLLAGVGDSLLIFTKGEIDNGWTLSMKRQIFQGQNVHGIRMNSNNFMICFGGRKICLLHLNPGKRRIRLVYSFQGPDWLLDCQWLDGEQAALLTANNAIVLCNLSIYKPVVNSVNYCRERCILYSGTILGNSWNDIVVLAGTVFSTILVWANSGRDQEEEIIHRLEGHKGAIFSINFCQKNQRICSTSDDRTVRVWDVEFEEPCNWKKCTITLKFTLYGHSARVWKSCLLECGQVVSVGEDSLICLWSNDGKLDTQYNGHQAGEIWSLDISEEDQLIATGGSDGGISLWPLKKAPLPQELKCGNDDLKPKCVGLFADGKPFMVSWTGDIFLFDGSMWKLTLSAPELESYCLHAVSPDRKLLAFASITGSIIICCVLGDSLRKIVHMNVCEGRIFSVIWLSCSSIVICGSAGEFSLWELSIDSEILKKEEDFILPHSKERWLTACSANDEYVLCGDRCGSLYLYSKGRQDKNPVDTAKKIHGQNGVTDIKYINGNFVSTGRDGKFREFLIKEGRLVMLRHCKLQFGWVAAVYNSDLFGRVLFCFHEVFFIIWNIKGWREIAKIDCGGGHRSWDCAISSTERSIFVTFIKGKSVHYWSLPIKDVLCQSLLHGSHPKSINSADSVNLSEEVAGGGKLILTGGEDCTLRLVSVNGENQTQRRVLQSHLSSVRAVACLQSTFCDALYIASGGGRGQLVLWKVYLSKNETLETEVDVVELTSYFVVPQKKTGVSTDAAEMRIMDLQLYQTCSVSVKIAACCSDGVLRIFNFLVDSCSITEAQAIDCQNCLLQVRVDYIDSRPLLSVTTTTGTLLCYSIENSGLLANDHTNLRLMVSETGINSCDCSEVNGSLLVACAGDDALVNILLLDWNLNERFQLTDKWVHSTAHVCQVSGLKIVNNFVFTVALDQKLAIFSWAISGNRIHAEMINRVDLCIPDIHGVLVWPCREKEYKILVYGQGTQLLKFSL